MLEIDGSWGEGGGQILRTSLSLSLVTGRSFRMVNIRAARDRPGLREQHLTAVRAAAQVGDAHVEGAEPGARTIAFEPGPVRGGTFRFALRGAGSTTLVLQTVLPPLLTAEEPAEVVLEGGTHNPFAPPFDFLAATYAPVIEQMGPTLDLRLDRHGFYPAGGGRFRARLSPCPSLEPLELMEGGRVRERRARALVAGLPRHIAEREVSVAHAMLGLRPDATKVVELPDDRGPGNVLFVEVERDRVTEVFTGFGRKGVPAEKVARQASREALEYLEADVPVGRHLADQLLLPLAMAGGTVRTLSPSSHLETNAFVVERFLDVAIVAEPVRREPAEPGGAGDPSYHDGEVWDVRVER